MPWSLRVPRAEVLLGATLGEGSFGVVRAARYRNAPVAVKQLRPSYGGEASLQAIRRGFTEHVDLRLQLGALSSAELRLMLRGNTRLGAAALLGCFQMPDDSAAAREKGAAIGLSPSPPRRTAAELGRGRCRSQQSAARPTRRLCCNVKL